MIASVRGTVAALGPDGAVVEVGGVGPVGVLLARHARPAAGRRAGPAGHQPGRARGLADPLRLRRRRRAGACSSCCRPPTASGPKLAQTMLAVHPPRELRRAIATSDYADAHRRPRHRPQGRRADRHRTARPDRRRSTAATDDAGAGRHHPVAPWRDQLAHALAGLGFSGKEAGDAIDVVAADAGDTPDVSALLRRSIQLLGTGDPCDRARPRISSSPLPVLAEREVEASACGRSRWASSSASPRCASSCSWCSSRRCGAAGRRTTSCCPGRPGWARPAWP